MESLNVFKQFIGKFYLQKLRLKGLKLGLEQN
jgi:hypothetical protein